mgnify:CR=1 FL=1
MTTKQILRTSTIIVLGNLQLIPCFLIFGSTIITIVLGIFYTLCLVFFWSSTRIGNGFFKNYIRANDRLEKYLFGKNTEC